MNLSFKSWNPKNDRFVEKRHASASWRWSSGYLCRRVIVGVGLMLAMTWTSRAGESARVIAHWPLASNARDIVGTSHGETTQIEFVDEGRPAAGFLAPESVITIADRDALRLGRRDFSLLLWAKREVPVTGPPGDLVCKFDSEKRVGLNLNFIGDASMGNAIGDTRHVSFGIDEGYLSPWEDHGRPWPSNSLISAMVVFEGELYVGIADADRVEDKAKVFRFAGGRKWIDCGRLGADPNHHSIQSMIVHQGKLYAGTGIWNWEQARGQTPGLPPAAPTRVYAYEGGTTWRDLGQVGHGTRVFGMASFQDSLFVTVDPRGGGHVFRYQGQGWEDLGSPDAGHPTVMLAFEGQLFVATRDSVFLHQGGTSWKSIGVRPRGVEQVHCLQTIGGKVHMGTWPQGFVLRYEGNEDWSIAGRLGLPEGTRLCNEVQSLCVYNGKPYAGVIPQAECYRFEKGQEWTRLGSFARRPDWEVNNYPTWVRVPCLAQFKGRLFLGTGACQGRALDAPADESLGRVYSAQAGLVVSHEHDIGGEWTHLAAVRQGGRLKLYVNGKLSASRESAEAAAFDLDNNAPLRIGFGAQSHFHGWISDVRLYEGAMDDASIRRIVESK